MKPIKRIPAALGILFAASAFAQETPRTYTPPAIPQRTARCDNIDGRFCVQPPETYAYNGDAGAGTIIIDTRARRLFLILENGMLRRYVIAVGRPQDVAPEGEYFIYRKAEWPEWRPTPRMQSQRNLPDMVPGGPRNPLGARALYLANEHGVDESYRIHGTNEPQSIGTAASSGCFRMLNADVEDLYARIAPGRAARVVVVNNPVYRQPQAQQGWPSPKGLY